MNDAYDNDAERTRGMLSILAAYWPWATWSPQRQQRVATRIVIATVRELIAKLPDLPDAIRAQCRNATDVTTAKSAVEAAYNTTEWLWPTAKTRTATKLVMEQEPAEAMAEVASAITAIAEALAGTAARTSVLNHACRIWIKAAS